MNVGIVWSAAEESSAGRVERGAYDLVVSDRPSICNIIISLLNRRKKDENNKPKCLSAHYRHPSQY